MVDSTYISNRKRYARPQGLLFANGPGTLVNGSYVPDGNEFGTMLGDQWLSPDWMVLTDDNRDVLSLDVDRIEQRKRTINGRSRSVHVADKKKLSVSWSMIPSRSFPAPQATAFIQEGDDRGQENYTMVSPANRYITDGGAGGADMELWYQDHPGTFWVYMAYDNFHRYHDEADPWAHLAKYSERVEMYFTSFTHSVKKRGQLFDFWDVSMSLEEA